MLDVGDWFNKTSNATTVTVNIDKTIAEPVINIISDSKYLKKSFTITGESEASIEYSLDNGTTWNSYTEEVILNEYKTYEIIAIQTDRAGNTKESTDLTEITIDMPGASQLVSHYAGAPGGEGFLDGFGSDAR